MSVKNFRGHRPRYNPLRKIQTGLAGIKQSLLLDFTVRYKLILSLLFLIIAGLFETLFHFLFVLAVTGLMLATEILNTALESLCDFVHPEHDEQIKKIKDIAAGATLITVVIWYVVLGVVAYELFSARHR